MFGLFAKNNEENNDEILSGNPITAFDLYAAAALVGLMTAYPKMTEGRLTTVAMSQAKSMMMKRPKLSSDVESLEHRIEQLEKNQLNNK